MSDIPCRSLNLTLVALVFAGLAGCSSLNGASARIAGIVSPYKMDIVQGNVVTKEQLAQLKPGMQRAQVRDILGTALLVSVFHADRWDYVFTLKQQGAVPQSRKVTVFFKNDLVERTEADALPSEAEFVATLKSPSLPNSVPSLQASEESLSKYPPPSRPAAATATVVAAPSDYPPLEATRP
ncbi:outer membrane protein assembly factor BamE [Rhodoferax sp. AJA081-3]|uniref:outer membrane protein assembly factor BamE n=1 Tax=Rhodoferax sp. AJA081-3 TaxID=2752316 RepID=UPI001ADF6768|nr:outer membrane protein assembly factor BamE [Rhodoferax sp. AJA081-3]QTN26915.1 outer membrane protein assembly factor BamE [Rhodoferax sp. AJA081-3]